MKKIMLICGVFVGLSGCSSTEPVRYDTTSFSSGIQANKDIQFELERNERMMLWRQPDFMLEYLRESRIINEPMGEFR